MPRVPETTESATGLENIESESELDRCRNIPESDSSLRSPNDLEPPEDATNQTLQHRGTEYDTKYKTRWFGYIAEEDTYGSASEMPASFFGAAGLPAST